MKRIKFLMVAFMAAMMGMSFSSCSKDDEETSSNWEKYQKEVDAQVSKSKTKDNVILLVAFGSTWQQAYDTFAQVEADYKANYSGNWDVYLAFSSAKCINEAAAGENADNADHPTEVRQYYDPEHWLTAIGKAGYKQIVVQSLQVIPGEEYRLVRDNYVKSFMNNRNQNFTADYMHSIDKKVAIGAPLMAEEEDVEKLADVLLAESDVKAALENNGIVAFMGHGNPVDYDYYGANVRYTQLEEAFQTKGKRCFVGTVDMEDNFVDNVIERMAEKGITSGNVQLYPLMSIAGDHAHNDMADPEVYENEDDWSWYVVFNKKGFKATAYETNFATPCWKNAEQIKKQGYIPALGERKAVRKLWMNHTQAAIDAIKNGQGLSTPTTAPEE